MPSTPLTLKIQEGSKLASFVEYYEDFHSEVSDTGRNRKGNVKKFLLKELECLVSTGKPAEFPAEVEQFQEYQSHDPEMMEKMKKLSPEDQKTFKALLAKIG